MTEQKTAIVEPRNMKRRSFLKGTALLGTLAAAGGLAGCSESEPKSEDGRLADTNANQQDEETYVCGCHDNCGTGCCWDVTVRDGYVVNCEPHPFEDDEEGIHREGCGRGILNLQRLYDADRLKYPMKRVNSKDEDPQWEQITWEEAIDIIAEKWTAILDEQGPMGLGFWSQYGSTGLVNGTMGTWARFGKALGACTIQTGADGPWIDMVSQITGGSKTSPASLRQVETFVFWGDNCMETKPQFWRYAMDARESHDVDIWTIDPNSTITAIRSDHHLPINPATDGALAMACMQVIFENGWEDKELVQYKSSAPYLVKADGTALRQSDLGDQIAEDAPDEIVVWDLADNTAKVISAVADPSSIALEGSYDVKGIPVTTALTMLKDRVSEMTPQRAEGITGIPAASIVDLAKALTATKALVWHQNGYTHYKNGVHNALAVYALMVVSGCIGKLGQGMDVGYAGFGFNMDWFMTGTNALGIPDNKIYEVATTGKLDEMEVPLKSVLIFAANVCGANSDRTKVEETLKALDFVVVPEYRMTDTCKFADILLPVSHWWERNDVNCTTLTVPYARIEEKAVEAQFEAKSDYEIGQMLAAKMGLSELFQGSDVEHLSFALDCEGNRSLHCTYEDLQEKKAVRICEDEVIFPADGSFSSENGRANFFLDKPAPLGNYGQTLDYTQFCLPSWTPNAEVLSDHPLAKKYPLLFITPHTKYGTQTTFHYVPWLEEVLGEPLVHMNPVDAAARGLVDGDYARFFNDRGEAVIKVKINSGIMPGMTVNYHGWSKEHYKLGHYQYLSTNDNSDPLTSNQAVFDVRIEVEKYEEA